MALPTIVNVGTVSAGTGDVVPGLPSGWAADDIHLAVVEQSAVNDFLAPPTGWVLVTGCQVEAGATATDACFSVYWRRAVGGDTAPTFTDTINHTAARIIGIRGCITTGNPWDVVNAGTDTVANTSVSVTGNTTTVIDCMVVIFVSTSSDIASTTEISGWTNGNLANLTERMDDWALNGNGGGFACATGEKATIGAYGATTATLVTSANKAFCTIALKPPALAAVKPQIVQNNLTVRRSYTW